MKSNRVVFGLTREHPARSHSSDSKWPCVGLSYKGWRPNLSESYGLETTLSGPVLHWMIVWSSERRSIFRRTLLVGRVCLSLMSFKGVAAVGSKVVSSVTLFALSIAWYLSSVRREELFWFSVSSYRLNALLCSSAHIVCFVLLEFSLQEEPQRLQVDVNRTMILRIRCCFLLKKGSVL